MNLLTTNGMLKDTTETSEDKNLTTQQRNPADSNSNMALLKSDSYSKEQELELKNWRGSNKIKGAVWYFVFGLYLLIAGIVFAAKNDDITELQSNYQQTCSSSPCTFTITVSDQITGPVYLFVEIKNYYQNNYVYLDGYNPSQIYSDLSDGSNSDCDPFLTNAQMVPSPTGNVWKNYDGSVVLNKNDVAIPCGMRAYDHFTDTFTIKKQGTSNYLTIKTDKISWKHDREQIKNAHPEKQWLDLEDAYKVLEKQTTKSLILSNLNSTGGKNLMLVGCHLAGGSIILLLSVVLTLWHYRKRIPR